jgi:ribosomal protein S18 acetylase RimI-like enzyme
VAEDKPTTPSLAMVRRYEAAGFRAWPAETVHYDGTWVVRLTAGHPAKRLNSINPLDPSDVANLPERIADATRRFEACGRPVIFRISPLSGAALSRYLDKQGWSTLGESVVMRMPLDTIAVEQAMDQIPLKDIGRFVAATNKVRGICASSRPGLSQIIKAIQPRTGLFVLENDVKALATAICVHEGDLAGLFEIVTDPAERGKGHGRRLVLSALKWARLQGAREGWLQVEADNEAARHLYGSIGFQEAYRYHYRRAPET